MSQSIKDRAQRWAFENQPDQRIVSLLGSIPGRWGRMSPLSRLLIVETGRVLQEKGILIKGQRLSEMNKKAGLIGGTKRGSLYTDQEFIATMADGPGCASPSLFGYTLPNIPLAEAASFYGLIGPVYSLFDAREPLKKAVDEARCLLMMQKDLDLMLACEFDHYGRRGRKEKLSVTLTVVKHNADSNSGVP